MWCCSNATCNGSYCQLSIVFSEILDSQAAAAHLTTVHPVVKVSLAYLQLLYL